MSIINWRRTIHWTSVLGVLIVAAAAIQLYLRPSANRLVRQVTVACAARDQLALNQNLCVYRSRAQLEAERPGAKIDPPGSVDFSRENLVQVKWSQPGHGEPGQAWTWNARAGGRWLAFCEHKPLWGQGHSCFYKIWLEQWFAVPKGSSVVLGKPQHFLPMDASVLGALVILAIGAVRLSSRTAAKV